MLLTGSESRADFPELIQEANFIKNDSFFSEMGHILKLALLRIYAFLSHEEKNFSTKYGKEFLKILFSFFISLFRSRIVN